MNTTQTNSDKMLTFEYLDWYAKLTGLPSILTDKIRSKTNPNKMEHGEDPENFSVITEAEKGRKILENIINF
ncbi:14982_t:CDS:2 [Entrophospora sp. SA101]|nr:14982_t:CDS:2 [Entrophospora sp. SA101]